ncbi:MAG TPA: hypothetical protein VFK90_04405 [Anaeromyxobacter sp.]|nr:hypothetical protein [Anaeromyxobacter sp.]
MRRIPPAFAVLAAAALACAGARPYPPLPEGLDDGAARASLARFARALEASRFDEAAALLSARWRAAYTPGRLALDFGGAGPSAREAAERVLAALDARAPLEMSGGRARLPVGPGRSAVLVAEGGAWRVDALE